MTDDSSEGPDEPTLGATHVGPGVTDGGESDSSEGSDSTSDPVAMQEAMGERPGPSEGSDEMPLDLLLWWVLVGTCSIAILAWVVLHVV